jgi:hypothetical protein
MLVSRGSGGEERERERKRERTPPFAVISGAVFEPQESNLVRSKGFAEEKILEVNLVSFLFSRFLAALEFDFRALYWLGRPSTT